MQLKPKNKELLEACHRISVKRLEDKDRDFINSLMRQTIHDPEGFDISEKQMSWLRDIWHRYHLHAHY